MGGFTLICVSKYLQNFGDRMFKTQLGLFSYHRSRPTIPTPIGLNLGLLGLPRKIVNLRLGLVLNMFSYSRTTPSSLVKSVSNIRCRYILWLKARRVSRINCGISSKIVYFAGILNVLGLKEKADPESVLIMTMKRAVLLIQNGEHKKAEQMLHLALRIAQEEQNKDAITYIHDLLANLAFDQGDLQKAEKLFVSVMQRLLSSGIPQDDIKIIHMSLKLANIYNVNKDYTKAEDGFQFCSKGLAKKIDSGIVDDDTFLLWAMTLDWYGRFLLEQNRSDEAFQCFEKAYNLSVKLNGAIHEQNVVLLNDLGTICCLKGNNAEALRYLHKAIEIGKHLPDMEDLGSVFVNLGNVYMKEGLYLESKKCCEEGWKNGKRHNNKEILAEANKCLDELKLAFS